MELFLQCEIQSAEQSPGAPEVNQISPIRAEQELGAPRVIKPDFCRRERFEGKADGAEKPERTDST